MKMCDKIRRDLQILGVFISSSDFISTPTSTFLFYIYVLNHNLISLKLGVMGVMPHICSENFQLMPSSPLRWGVIEKININALQV